MTLEALLLDLGLNVTASAIYDQAKAYFARTKTPTVAGLRDHLAASLSLDGASVAGRLVEFLAQNGNITITRSKISAQEQITMASFQGTAVTFGHGSVSRTPNTAIEAGQGAEIRMQGGAKIVQNPDGSISFFT